MPNTERKTNAVLPDALIMHIRVLCSGFVCNLLRPNLVRKHQLFPQASADKYEEVDTISLSDAVQEDVW